MTNKQESLNAAARLSKLPVVRSVCSTFSHIYTDTKHSHPNLKTLCELVENSATALSTVAADSVSPVFVKLQPQISAANGVVSKSLDWLESTFPVLHTPEEIVATARNKVQEMQDVVSIAANGTMDCVTWVLERMQHAVDGTNCTLAEQAITMASVGLDSALDTVEALMDQVLPPAEEEKKAAAAHLLQGFEEVTLRRSYIVRLASLTVELCRRTSHMVGAKVHYVQVVETFPSPSALVQHLQDVPQYLQHQAVSVFFFFSQIYQLGHPPSKQNQSNQVKQCVNATRVLSPHKGETQFKPKASAHTCRTRASKTTPVKGCVRHLK